MFPNNISSIHIEITDKCQASCPMCPRNQRGGAEGLNVHNVEATLEQFKTWFPPTFLNQLSSFLFCGNIGDPLMARECLEIFDYVKQSNPNCVVHVYTNGSLRTKDWWIKLASIMTKNDLVVFAIDGLEDTHSIYRRGTSWSKIIDNATTFINAGGVARADILVFKHNEHQIDELTSILTGIGFNQINARATDRFHGLDFFPVQNKKGEHEYNLYPAETIRWKPKAKPNYMKFIDSTIIADVIDRTVLDPKCAKGERIYVNAKGEVYPCTWVGSIQDNMLNPWERVEGELDIRQHFYQSALDLIAGVDKIVLGNTDIATAIAQSNWNTNLPDYWSKNKKLICANHCGTNFIDIIAKQL